jgi:hypothetical protein
MSDQPDAPASLSPGKNPDTLSAGGWVGPGVVQKVMKDKYLSPAGIQTPDRPKRILLTILTTTSDTKY